MFKFTSIALVLFATTGINLAVTSIIWKRRISKAGNYFALGMAAVTFWTLTVGLGYAAVPLDLTILFAKFDALGYQAALVFFFITSLHIAGLGSWMEKAWLKTLIFLPPAASILLIATNELHGWVWIGFRPVGNNIFVFEHGPGFTWIASFGYVLILSMLGVLIWAARVGDNIQRRQSRILLFATVVPIMANIAYLHGFPGVEGVDWSSITFSVTGLIFLRGVYGNYLLDLTSIARDTLFSSMSDGILMLNAKNRIMEINQTAAQLLGSSPEKAMGNFLLEVEPLAMQISGYLGGSEQKVEIMIGGRELRYYDALISPLRNRSQNFIGHLIIFRDITERKLAEKKLEEHLFEIQALNKELEDAQTHIMEQQRSFAIVEERQRLGRDLHDSVNQSIHSLMLFSETLIALLQNGDTEQAIRAAERIHESGEQALKEVRLLVHEGQEIFIGGYDDLILAIEKRLNMVERRANIQADFSYDISALERSPKEWMENIYWIILEGLNNSLKHSQASHIQVHIMGKLEQLTVEVKDDGAGFDPRQAGGGGFGMQSMQERAEVLGGVLSVKSSPGHGTRVKCIVEIPRP